MLAERLPSAQEILDKMEGKCAFEYKYDGLRIQAHIEGDKVVLFSRRLEDLTDQFPDVVQALKNSIKCRSALYSLYPRIPPYRRKRSAN
jgi:DNA ligase-1